MGTKPWTSLSWESCSAWLLLSTAQREGTQGGPADFSSHPTYYHGKSDSCEHQVKFVLQTPTGEDRPILLCEGYKAVLYTSARMRT